MLASYPKIFFLFKTEFFQSAICLLLQNRGGKDAKMWKEMRVLENISYLYTILFCREKQI